MGPLILFGFFILIIIAAIVYAIIMLAITYWPITLTIIGLLILNWKWGSIKKIQKQKRIKKDQERQKQYWKKCEQERKQRDASKERQFWENFWKNNERTIIEQLALPDKTKKSKRKSKSGFKGAYDYNQNYDYEKTNDNYDEAWNDYKERFGTARDEIEKYYKILELDSRATINQVKSKFRELALKYHPDRNNDKQQAAEKFKEIFQARQIILEALGVMV